VSEAPRSASQGRIRELADWYSDQTYQRYNENILDTAALDAELRAILRKEVFPSSSYRVQARHEGGVRAILGLSRNASFAAAQKGASYHHPNWAPAT
jgi:hypothetical protein